MTRTSSTEWRCYRRPLEGRPHRHGATPRVPTAITAPCLPRQGGDRAAPEEPAAGEYRPLVLEIVKFFQTAKPPVPNEETLEIFAFMDAAQRSKEQGGIPVRLE